MLVSKAVPHGSRWNAWSTSSGWCSFFLDLVPSSNDSSSLSLSTREWRRTATQTTAAAKLTGIHQQCVRQGLLPPPLSIMPERTKGTPQRHGIHLRKVSSCSCMRSTMRAPSTRLSLWSSSLPSLRLPPHAAGSLLRTVLEWDGPRLARTQCCVAGEIGHDARQNPLGRTG